MRIISGSHKGRTIVPPRNFRARPTTDFAKESLFNVLNNITDIVDSEILDLFAGTGSISLEFASRGAKKVDTVEINKIHHAFIRETVSKFGLEQIHAIKTNALKFILFCTATYDIIFADPPYEMPDIDKIPDTIFEYNLLKTNGLLIMEHSEKYDFSSHPKFYDNRNYGSVNFTFFK
ncbi:MAG: 16S rRNA (guanine(966)-N(2))-methyltransferase RsmD [Prevotellaceae bacterium]|jgi:16S rRNA (guanine(966)-N(2))-methyltransferase RsmD|nr:16S rRNA (guanine(966)-N(2))-methyltransferase RsmD [Prevotellaceae bacterium]